MVRTNLAFATLWLTVVVTLGAPPQPMTPVDFLSLPSVGSFDLAPGGRRVVYVQSDARWSENRRSRSLWVSDSDTGKARQWVHGRDGVDSPRWSPDGSWLAFTAKGSEAPVDQIYLSPLAGGDSFQMTEHTTNVSSLQWSPNGAPWLYFLAEEETAASEPELKDLIAPFDSSPKQQLWRARVPGGGCERLTTGPLHVRSYHASPAGVVLHRSEGALIDDRHDSSSLWLIGLDGASPRRLPGPTHSQESPRLSPAGDRVLYLADVNAAGDPYYQTNLFYLSVGQPEDRRELVAEEPFEVREACWGPGGESVFLTANMGVESQLLELDLESGHLKPLTDGEHDVIAWRYAPESDSFVLRITTALSPGELWRLSRSEGARPVGLTSAHAGLAGRFALPRQRVVRWQAADGMQLEGLVTTPTDGSLPPHPLVVQSHGGPRSSDRWGVWKWKNYEPVLAACGYATLRVNYRGSTGYGEPFHRDMVGNYWQNAHTDVLSGVDHLVELGLADAGRLAAMGWSAGGHMTNKLITTTDRFKAASSGAGAVEWVSMYSESDTRRRREPWFGGPPWGPNAPLDDYREQSSLFDIWRVKTPTILFVGEEDRRVPRTQSILLSRALRDAGVPSRLYVAPGQGHDWKPLDQRLFKINAELEWFERHVRGRTYRWQSPPEGRRVGKNQ